MIRNLATSECVMGKYEHGSAKSSVGEAVTPMGGLVAVEKQGKELAAEEHLALRRRQSQPMLAELREELPSWTAACGVSRKALRRWCVEPEATLARGDFNKHSC